MSFHLAADGMKVDSRRYAGALNAVAGNISSSDPMWTVMGVNADTREPSEGFWQADYPTSSTGLQRP